MSYQPPPPPYQPPAGGQPPTYGGGPMPGGGDLRPVYSPIEAVKYGWSGFTRNLAPFLVITAITLVLNGIIQFGTNLATTGSLMGGGGTVDPETGLPDNFLVAQLASMVSGLVAGAISWVLGLALVRGALDVVDTGRTDLGAMFSRIPWGQALLAGLLVGLATFVGTLLCIIPGIVLGFLLYYTNIAVVDGHSATDGIGASYRFTSGNLGETLLLALLAIGMIVLSFCTLGIALLAVIPVLSIAAVYTWRSLQGRPVTRL